MKIRSYLYLFFILFFVSFIVISCNNKFSGEWVAKIDGDTVTIDQLEIYYYAQQKSIYNITKVEIDKLASDPASLEKNPTLNKQEFLEQLIRQRLVYKQAFEEGLLKNPEVDALIKMAEEAVVVGYYVREKFKDEISVTDEEVEKIYSQKRSNFKGVPIEQAELYIKQQVLQQKLQLKIRELVESLREKSKIEKNASLLNEKREEADTKGKSGSTKGK